MPPRPDLRRIYLAKLVALGSVVVAVWLLRWFISPSSLAAPITVVVGLCAIPSALVWWASPAVRPALLSLSFAADVMGITAGVHFGGGADQVSAPLLYTAIIGLGGILISPLAAYAIAAASSAAYSALIALEYAQWLPHRVSYSRPPDRQVATALMVTVFLFLVAWLVSYAARQIRDAYRHAEEVRRAAVTELSHDLKNPLTIIHGYAQMIVDGAAMRPAEPARRIQDAAHRALDLVRNVLDSAAIEGREIALAHAPVPLNDTVVATLELYRPAADAKRIEVATALAVPPPYCSGDRDLLGRAIGNLVSNAIKYSPTGGRVSVATMQNGDAVEVSVRDQGPGIPAAEQLLLFEPYQRGASGRAVEGTGLGLFIVRRIVEAHGGRVTLIRSGPDGCQFILSLPRLTPP